MDAVLVIVPATTSCVEPVLMSTLTTIVAVKVYDYFNKKQKVD